MYVTVNATAKSNIVPIVKETNAIKSNLPLNLISRLSDFKDSRENRIPVIRNIKRLIMK
jgi:hypothetical protein